MSYLTWLDVERAIRKETANGSNLPPGIHQIQCFSDAIEVYVSEETSKDYVQEVFARWFRGWFDRDKVGIILDIKEKCIPIEIQKAGTGLGPINQKPLWKNIAYLPPESNDANAVLGAEPKSYAAGPRVIAFHSFKGGVGRTTSLATFAISIIQNSKRKLPIKILLIDADLEAPGLTYWLKGSNDSFVSFINFLEAIHYPPTNIEETIEFFCKELKKTSLTYSEAEIFFLPSCLNESQLLDTPILPEHIAKTPDNPWKCGDSIIELGKALNVQYIFIDLRAGLSEISSPILFDPRIERFLVTTISAQSVRGTSFVLGQINKFNNNANWIKKFNYRNPNILITFLTKELRESKAFDEALTAIEYAYPSRSDAEDSDNVLGILEILESNFSSTFLSISDWEDAFDKLQTSDLFPKAQSRFREIESTVSQVIASETGSKKLFEICKKYEYAEQGTFENLLITEPIRNLAKHHVDRLPNVISIGAKGAGKTFNYLQIASSLTWNRFKEKVIKSTPPQSACDANIFPLLQSANLQGEAMKIVDAARNSTFHSIGRVEDFSATGFRERIEDCIQKQSSWSKKDWSDFWASEFARAIGFPSGKSLDDLNQALNEANARLIFLIDGIEDTFRNISKSDTEQIALSALIDIPNKLSELRKSNIGLIIFLREDYVKVVTKQNLGQFLNRYNPYFISWNSEYFVKLVYWICAEAGVIGARKENIDLLSHPELLNELEKLWGKKLGGESEAYSANWVYAALTDLKGRLQARDIIRFLRYSSEKSISGATEKWADRLLPPPAIRGSLAPCSNQKVEEASQEYQVFKSWIERLTTIEPANKKIPFDPTRLGLDQETLETLKDIGIVFEDKERDDKARFYIPEIFRAGLEFRLEKGARPRVLVLQKRTMGSNLV